MSLIQPPPFCNCNSTHPFDHEDGCAYAEWKKNNPAPTPAENAAAENLIFAISETMARHQGKVPTQIESPDWEKYRDCTLEILAILTRHQREGEEGLRERQDLQDLLSDTR
jgi:hypothetical protein